MYTLINGFEWDPKKAASNLTKHGVRFEEGIEVFGDPVSIDKYDQEHSHTENRYSRIGSTSRGILVVVYTERQENIIRIISARRASRRERSFYHGQERKDRL